jgi:membrane associated rhomboid family serine protease
MATVVLSFAPPGFYAVDFPMEFRVDGVVVPTGTFRAGAHVAVDLAAGDHVLVATVQSPVPRSRTFSFTVGEEPLHVALTYDRWWGNFKKSLTIRAADHDDILRAQERTDARDAVEGSPLPPQPMAATFTLLGVLAFALALEYALPVAPRTGFAPNILTLQALGALGKEALRDGDYFRLLTATFLHADPVHLALNGVALGMAGVFLERKIGARWFVILYGISGLCGSYGSVLANKGNVLSVGASGAILGVVTAGMVLAELDPPAIRTGIRLQLARVLVPSLLPLAVHGDAPVDLGAHLGGALGGALSGGALYLFLRGPARSQDTAWKAALTAPLVTALAAVTVLVNAAALSRIPSRAYAPMRAEVALAATLIPNEELPKDSGPHNELFRVWASRFPNDPRVLLWQAEQARDSQDREAFERAIGAGYAASARTESYFGAEQKLKFDQEFKSLEGDRVFFDLLPNEQNPTGPDSVAVWNAHLDEWLKRYPKDPRVHKQAALRAYNAKDFPRALSEMDAAEAAVPGVAAAFPKGVDLSVLSAVRYFTLLRLKRDAEAAPVRAAVCAGTHGDYAQKLLVDAGDCPERASR